MPFLYVMLALLLTTFGTTSGCPNQCSGHGTCGKDEVCECFKDWGLGDEDHGDCSQRVCPYEIAFVDRPDSDGLFHNYLECAGKGVCDRTSGSCECFPGYTGKGCGRVECPNGCSGHGKCEHNYMLSYGPVPGHYDSTSGRTGIFTDAETFPEELGRFWDDAKYMQCVCDGGWTEVDCSKRMCPKGNDVLDERLNQEDKLQHQMQNITLYAAGPSGNGSASNIAEFYGQSFAFTFVSTLNETFSTIPIKISETSPTLNMSADISQALKGLPNKAIENCEANATFGYESRYDTPGRDQEVAFLNIQVLFSGASVQGPQNMLIVNAAKCEDGCNPQVTGLNLMSATTAGGLSSVTEGKPADYNNYECGRRGKCDYDSGLCDCFTGFTGEACNIQTALL